VAKVPNGVETLPKISIAWVGRTNVTDDWQTDRRTGDDICKEQNRNLPYISNSHSKLYLKLSSNCLPLNPVNLSYCHLYHHLVSPCIIITISFPFLFRPFGKFLLNRKFRRVPRLSRQLWRVLRPLKYNMYFWYRICTNHEKKYIFDPPSRKKTRICDSDINISFPHYRRSWRYGRVREGSLDSVIVSELVARWFSTCQRRLWDDISTLSVATLRSTFVDNNCGPVSDDFWRHFRRCLLISCCFPDRGVLLFWGLIRDILKNIWT